MSPNFFFGVSVAAAFGAGLIVGVFFVPWRFQMPSFKLPSVHPIVWAALLIALGLTAAAAFPRYTISGEVVVDRWTGQACRVYREGCF